mmetsp:Transcript_16607/g.49676  ORF Transcript_16607/g.49676 Transcript_16607/m.49676 type:complete len:342 (-) Transcript_16607:46-1071(-)
MEYRTRSGLYTRRYPTYETDKENLANAKNTRYHAHFPTSPPGRVLTTYCMDSLPIYISRGDLVPLCDPSGSDSDSSSSDGGGGGARRRTRGRSSSRGSRGSLASPTADPSYQSWLNATTIDAIVMHSHTHRPLRTVRAPRAIYLGSSFTPDSLGLASDAYVIKLASALEAANTLVMIVNVGLHWNLLVFERATREATLYDPMSSSKVSASFLIFAARVLGRESELDEALLSGRVRMLSVRTQLPRLTQRFFRLINVGVQLKENEGYNCGLYCALWARAFVHPRGTGEVTRYTREELGEQREAWQERLSEKLSLIQAHHSGHVSLIQMSPTPKSVGSRASVV